MINCAIYVYKKQRGISENYNSIIGYAQMRLLIMCHERRKETERPCRKAIKTQAPME